VKLTIAHRNEKYFFAIVVCLLTAPALLSHPSSHARPAGQTGPVIGKPVSATEKHQTQEILKDGTRSNQSFTGSFYRDDKGRMRVESSSLIVIFDPVAGMLYQLHPKAKTYGEQTVPLRGVQVFIAVVGEGVWIDISGGHSHGDESGTRKDLPPSVINGIQTVGTRLTVPIPRETVGNKRPLETVTERWYSEDLKLLVKSSNYDPRSGKASYELTNIVQGPPDPALFRVPQGYTLGEGKEGQ